MNSLTQRILNILKDHPEGCSLNAILVFTGAGLNTDFVDTSDVITTLAYLLSTRQIDYKNDCYLLVK